MDIGGVPASALGVITPFDMISYPQQPRMATMLPWSGPFVTVASLGIQL